MSRIKTLYFISGILLVAIFLIGSVERKKNIIGNKIIWSKNKLTWSNFTKVEKKEGDYVATISYGIYCPENISWWGSSNIYAYMNPDESERLADSMLDDQVLVHEQYHFNITEYHARLLRKDLIKIGKNKLNRKIRDSLFNKYTSENDLMQDQYDSITDHNVNTEKQRYWEMKIDDLMRQTAYYQNIDIDSYQNYSKENTKYFRKIYKTFDNNILCSFPIYEQDIKFGESYKIDENDSETIVSFLKNGVPKNGGVFNTAITSIKNNEDKMEVHYFNPNGTLNNKLDYCIFKRYNKNSNKIDQYYNYKKERISVNKVYQTVSKIDSERCYITSYYNKNLNKIKNKYGINYKKRTLDSLGRTIKLEFLDINNSPVNDTEFISKVVKEYDSNNLLISYQEYGDDGDFAKHLFSYNHKYEYDERGNLKKSINLNQNYKIAPNSNGISIYTYTYDLNDNVTSTKRFNKYNDPILGVDDYHMDIEKFDNEGRTLFYGKYYPGYVLSFTDEKWGATKYIYPNDSIIYEHNVDVYDDNFNDNTGIAIIKKYLNKNNKVKKSIYLDTNYNYSKTEDNIVQFHNKYDEYGNEIEQATLDSLGNLMAFEEDVAIVKWDYDKNNNKIKTTYYNTTSELANANQNVTYNIYIYNDDNQLIERSNYNKRMEPELLGDYFKRKFIPNSFGSDSIRMDYDTNNKLIEGACKTIYTYNKFNNNISESFYNKDDEPTINNLGVHLIKYHYNAKQEYIGHSYFDESGKRTNNKDGISYNKQTLNELGYIVLDTYYNKNNFAVLGPEGYHKKEQTWNDKGELIKIRTIGVNNKLINDNTGVAEYHYTRSYSGQISSIKRYNHLGKLTNNIYGVAETYYNQYLNGLYFLDRELDSSGKILTDSSNNE